jgi:DUF4097 and DUF4098 domain-containing protein YvlB
MTISKKRKRHDLKGVTDVPKEKKVRSGYEAKVRKSLESRGVDYEYEKDVLPYIVPQSTHKYHADFTVKCESGHTLYIESKGNFTAADRKKMKLVIEQHPDKDIRMLFMRNNKIQRNSKTTYGMWCDKHGIKWAVSSTGHAPDSWIRGDD